MIENFLSLFKAGTFLLELIKSFTNELALVFTLWITRFIGFDLFNKSVRLWRLYIFYIRRIFGNRYALVYTDCDASGDVVKRICCNLNSNNKNIKYIPIDNPEEILKFPLSPYLCKSVSILITDVSPLSTDSSKRLDIQKRLEKFTSKGGTLVLGHDTIYRRTRNEIFQKIAGCKLDEFYSEGCSATPYKKLTSAEDDESYRICKDSALLDILPDNFCLHDGEVVTGKWAKDVEYLYIHAGKEAEPPLFPLLTRKQLEHGYVFWVNSGDRTKDGEPHSHTAADQNFMTILQAITTHQIT